MSGSAHSTQTTLGLYCGTGSTKSHDAECDISLSESYLDQRSTLRFRFDRPLPSAALKSAIQRKANLLDEAR